MRTVPAKLKVSRERVSHKLDERNRGGVSLWKHLVRNIKRHLYYVICHIGAADAVLLVAADWYDNHAWKYVKRTWKLIVFVRLFYTSDSLHVC
ncbi:unnamed protein product [marine sediment metagenome]|uniref:Uncharacterized protein n=1 Tax=marine sediment metagenome TaxID=412755 RepID=X1CP97_9ZZZZ